MTCRHFNKMLITQSLYLLILIVFPAFLNAKPESNIHVIFRIDDFGIDNELFYPKLFEIFEKHNTSLIIGVVPYKMIDGKLSGLSELQIKILKQGQTKGLIEIAQHGMNHINNSRPPATASEFKGLSFHEQYCRILKGKRYLEETFQGSKIITFIPPWNSFDENTILALEKLDFKFISPSIVSSKFNKIPTSIKFIPSTISIHQLNKSIKSIPPNKDALIVVLFHGYDFESNKEFYIHKYPYKVHSNFTFSYNKLDSLLSQVDSNNRVTSVPANSILERSLSAAVYYARTTKKYLLPIPPQLVHRASYISLNSRPNNLLYFVCAPIVFYLGIILLTFITINYSFHKICKSSTTVLIIFSMIIVLLLLLYSLRDGRITYKTTLLISVSIGVIVAHINNTIRMHHQ